MTLKLDKMYRLCDYDLEIQDDPNIVGWNKSHLFNVSTLAYTIMVISTDFSIRAFYQRIVTVDDIKEFCEEVEKSDIITGWNTKTFDNVVMQKYFNRDVFSEKINFDLMQQVRALTKVMFKLENIGAAMGVSKLDDGADGKAIDLWESAQQGNANAMYKLIKYNLGDTFIDSLFLQRIFLTNESTPFTVEKQTSKGNIKKVFDLYELKKRFVECLQNHEQKTFL